MKTEFLTVNLSDYSNEIQKVLQFVKENNLPIVLIINNQIIKDVHNSTLYNANVSGSACKTKT